MRSVIDLGFVADEYDPDAGRQLGNFPQVFSHVMLIDTCATPVPPDPPRHVRQRDDSDTAQT